MGWQLVGQSSHNVCLADGKRLLKILRKPDPSLDSRVQFAKSLRDFYSDILPERSRLQFVPLLGIRDIQVETLGVYAQLFQLSGIAVLPAIETIYIEPVLEFKPKCPLPLFPNAERSRASLTQSVSFEPRHLFFPAAMPDFMAETMRSAHRTKPEGQGDKLLSIFEDPGILLLPYFHAFSEGVQLLAKQLAGEMPTTHPQDVQSLYTVREGDSELERLEQSLLSEFHASSRTVNSVNCLTARANLEASVRALQTANCKYALLLSERMPRSEELIRRMLGRYVVGRVLSDVSILQDATGCLNVIDYDGKNDLQSKMFEWGAQLQLHSSTLVNTHYGTVA